MTKAPGTARRRVALPILIIASLGLAAPSLAFDSGNSGGNAGGGSNGGGGSTSATVSAVTLADARAHIKRQRWKQAIAVLKQIIADDPGNADALNLMGYSLRKSGNTKSAQGFYLKALKLKPGHRDANEYLGELYVEIGQLAKAKERLQALKDICGTGCEQYRELKQTIDAAG